MNKTVLALLIVIAAGGAGYAIYNNKNKGASEGNYVASENTQAENEVNVEGKKMAFAQFVKQGGSYECTVNQYVENVESKGHVFIDDGRIRGEYSVDYNGTKMNGSVIVKDGFAYTWSDMMKGMGFKVPVNEGEVNVDAGTKGTYSWNAEQIGDYNCDAWKVDESKFALPAGVTFKTMAEMQP